MISLESSSRLIAAILATSLALAGACSGQTTQLGNRVIHIYVDPLHGDDDAVLGVDCAAPATAALLGNPQNPGYWPCTTISATAPSSPAEVFDGTNILMHAPFPFRTVTKAIAYIPALPKTVTKTVTLGGTQRTYQVTWTHAIIHLLPGVYSNSTPYKSYHPDNGRRMNREVFPIRLPNRVSLQGTSALNTVFYVQGKGPVFEFGTTAANTGEETFIDGVGIYGADGDLNIGNDYLWTLLARHHCAIYLGPAYASKPTISNCFIYRNIVGICVAAPFTDGENVLPGFHDGTQIISNTFADNHCAIWNGELNLNETNPFPTSMTPVHGISRLIIVNNIIDNWDRFHALNVSRSPGCPLPLTWRTTNAAGNPWSQIGGNFNRSFEGVHPDDMVVGTQQDPVIGQVVDLSLPGGIRVNWFGNTDNYNAFEAYHANLDPTIRVGAGLAAPNNYGGSRTGNPTVISHILPGLPITVPRAVAGHVWRNTSPDNSSD